MKQSFFAGLLAAALCLAAGPARADYLSMDMFGHSIKLMVDGYTGTETLTNFPVLVRLAEYDAGNQKGIPGFLYSDLTNNKGKDIAFFDELGNHLASEIQTNDWTTSGTSLVWVSLPRMQQGTKFYLCYNTTESGVFVTNQNPWTDYVAVWHMDEQGGENKPIFDSTTNGLHGVNRSTTGARTDGVVGSARKIATSNAHDKGIIVPATNGWQKTAADSLGTDFHASFWVRPQGTKMDERRWSNLLGRRKGDMGESWGVSIDDNAEGLRLYAYNQLWTDGKQQRFASTARDSGHGAGAPTISNTFPFLNVQGGNGWQKIDVLWKYTTAGGSACYEVYSNGVLAAAGALIGPVSDVPANIGIGCSTQDVYGDKIAAQKGRRFKGDMDEVRLRPGIVSADWIKADFDTMNNASFVTVAPPEVLEVAWSEDAGRSGVTNVAWNAAAVGGIVTGLGPGATEATIEGKFWADGENEPATWTVLASGLDRLDAFEAVVSCAENTTYHYALRATDDANGETTPVTGTFATPLGLAVTWAEVPGRVGVTNVLGHGVVVGGSIGCLGDSATVTVEGKIWPNDGEEPTAWTPLAGSLAQTGDFSASVSSLVVDTLYRYKLRVAGGNGNATEPVSGTFTTSHGLTVSWAGSAEQPGVTNVAWNAAVVGGIVEALGDVASCTIEGKFWAGETEPAEWSSLGAGRGEGTFSIQIPNLSENTTYQYKLRATETDGSETPVASGSFTTPIGLAASWADEVSGRPGVTDIGVFSATVGGSVECLGDSASCTIQGKFWTGETEPEIWTTIGETLSQTGVFSATVSDLAGGTAYSYKLRLLGINGAATVPVSGTFTTHPALTVAWSTATSSPGIASVGYGFVAVGGQVTALGEATSCSIQAKIWIAGGTEPAEWTTLKESLGLNGTFSVNVPGLAAGTTYRYELRAVGNDGEVTSLVSSSFTTPGESGEELGSDYTEFFDDGTNAVWIAKGFERYLPFTVTGYTGTETLTNFPVLVEVRGKDTNGFSYDDFYHYDGADIVFVDEKGHIIPHEIDTWNKGGMSLFWVRLPEMVNGTKFTMCYRSPLLETPPDPGNVFEKYVGVWHMSEKGDGVVNLKDSTVNDFETETHAQSLYSGNGRIGGARRVAQQPGSAASYGRIVAFDHDDILRTGVGNVFTYSAWYKLEQPPPKWAYLVSRKSEDGDRGWGVQYQEDSTAELRVWSGSQAKNAFQVFKGFSGTGTSWHYWTFIFDGNGPFGPGTNGLFHAYLDGVEVSSTVGGFPLKYDIANDATADYDNLCVVGQQNGTGAFNGLADEARYSKGIRSADWIKAEYVSTMQAQWWNTDKRFVTKGTVSRGADSPVPVVVWEKGDGLPVSILDVSYAYVQFAGTVTFCGANAETCDIEYLLWADGEEEPTDSDWATLLAGATRGTSFSIPVTGLKQDMPYKFRIRAVNEVDGRRQANREQTGSFRTSGNVNEEAEGELLRVDNRFCHRYGKGSYTFTTPDYVTNIEIMVVGGGGAGGYKVGGGGGGGGLFYSASYPVTTSTVYRIQVGEGGNAASNLLERSEDGQYSFFALDSDSAHPLILVPGGGAGGSYADNATIAVGADGASGGGGTYAKMGGTATDDGAYGHAGGRGNDFLQGGAKGKVAAGGGGGAGRIGLGATFDLWSTGGSGGVGVGNSMTGETLFYGAGGGGGYIYWTATAKDGSLNFTKPGGGGSGIGGNAADVQNGTPATSGVENTGAGGGGGSSRGTGKDGTSVDESDSTYWQGGDGGDGVVLIAYEVHGRDPISEDPRIEMTRCDYNPDAGTTGAGVATIDYRAFWAGIQAYSNDVFVLYSTAGLDEITNGIGERIQITSGAIGVGTATFVPPEVGHTYWIRLVSRKDAGSFVYSDEIASFFVPAVTLNGVLWQGGTTNAVVEFALHDPAPDTHLHCYWSENRAQLEGDATPSGDGVRFLDLGAGMAGATSFVVPASEGLDRSRVYYFRLAAGDDGGLRHPLSAEIVELRDEAAVVLSSASWADQVATVGFTANLVDLDPERTELVAFYSTVPNEVNDGAVNMKTAPAEKGCPRAVLGTFAELAEGAAGTASFPLWSDANATYHVRLALHSMVDDTWPAYSSVAAIRELGVTGLNPNTLLIFASANPKKGAYGDAPQALDVSMSYGGLTNAVAMANRPEVAGSPSCAVTATSDSGIYDIGQGTLGIDPAESEKYIEGAYYYYRLVFVGAQYTVTNAVFSATIPDIATAYTGEALDTSAIAPVVTGVRNDQPVTYRYRVGTNDWTASFDTTFSNIWMNIVQFRASAPNHDDAAGTFMVTIEPAPLFATISAGNLDYTGEAQTPAVTTGVSGHMHPDRNPLTCLFRDDAGEWRSEVPSFTQPGTYRLWFRVSAPNHATYTTNCTFTIEGWDFMVNMDGETGYATPLRVTDPGWFLRATGEPSASFTNPQERYARLDAVCANGLKLWQNYVIERDDLSEKLYASLHQACQRVAENNFELRFPNVNALRNTGLSVRFRVDRKLRGENAFTEGPLSADYDMDVPLLKEGDPDFDPTGLYIFNMVLVPTNAPYAGQAVLSSVATVGVLRVSCPATNAIVAAPWISASKDEEVDEPVLVSETVNPNGLSAGDRILAHASASNFCAWAYESGTTWNALEAGASDGVSVVATNATEFPRGSAFWLVRPDPGPYVYLVGRYAGDLYTNELACGTSVAPGYTLVANPTFDPVALNDLAFVDGSGDPATPADGDRIVLQDAAGFQRVYVRRSGAWGRYVSRKENGRIVQTWSTDGAVLSGTGFWYVRTADSPLYIRFGGAQ